MTNTATDFNRAQFIIMKYEFHEVAGIFPMLGATEISELAEDIKEHGLKERIWLYEDKIIDGRNRYLACEKAGIVPQFREWAGTGDLLDFVLSLNLHRRHLNESQRAMVAVNVANMRQGERTDVEPSANLRKVSQSQAAEKLKVSERSVTSAAKVKSEGSPELITAVESGTIAVSTAANITTLPKTEQTEAVAGGKETTQAASKKAQATKKEKSPEEGPSIEEQIAALPLAQALDIYAHGGHLFRQQASLWHAHNKAVKAAAAALSGVRHTKGPFTEAVNALGKFPNPDQWEGCPACKGSLRFGERRDPCASCNSTGFTIRKNEGVSADVVAAHAAEFIR